MKKQENINPTDLDLMDWKEIEKESINQVKISQKIFVAASQMLKEATMMIKALGGETERERLIRVRDEAKTQRESST